MLEIVLRRERGHVTTLDETTMKKEENKVKGIIIIEDMKEEEGTPQVTVNKIIILKRSQGILGMKVTL